MSRQSFITQGPIPANMNGIDLTFERYAVDRFYHPDDGAAAYLVDNAQTLANNFAAAALAGNTLTITGAISPTGAITYNIINRSVVINAATASITSGANGVHFNFINCQIDIRNGTTGAAVVLGSWPNAGNETERVAETFTDIVNPTAAQLATARTNSRSLNLYGCSINIIDSTGSRFYSPSDMFDCELDWASASATNGALFGTPTNGRWVRTAFRKVVDANTANQAARTNPYGPLRQLAAPVFDGYGIRQGNTGYDTTLIVDEPNFPNDRQASFYSMNVVNNDADQPIQVIGGPSLGAVNDAWGSLNGAAGAGLISESNTAASFSGVLTTVADKRRFFSDAQLTTGANEIILRTRINAVDVFANAGQWAGRAQAVAGRTTTANRDIIVDYETNGQGIWSSFRYSVDGGSTYSPGFVDWFMWNTNSNQRETNLATAWSGNAAPPGTVVIPAQNTYSIANNNTVGSKILTPYSLETEIRSLIWDMAEASDVYTLPAAGLPLRVTSGDNVVVRDANVVAATLATAEAPFATVSAKTLQQLADKAKRDWALFDLDQLRGVSNNNFTWTGGITISGNNTDTVLTGNNITFNRVSSLDTSNDPITGISVTTGLIMAVPFGGRFTAGTSINAGNQNTEITDLTTPTINNWSVTATHGVTTINGATTVNLTNAGSGPHLAADIFGIAEPEGTGTITLNADVATTIQIADASSPTTTRFRAGTNVAIEQAPAAPVINTVNIDTTVGGYYAITQTISGTETEVRGRTRFTAGSTITSPNFSSETFTAGVDTINVYIKYDSDVVNNNYYVEQLFNFTFSSTQGTVHQVNVPVMVSRALVGTATPLPANVGVATVFNDALSANNVLVTVTNTSAQSALSLGQNQGLTLAATIGNTEAYFDSWYGNRATTVNPMLEFRQNETVNWDNTRVTFASGNLSDGFRIQHVVQNWESTGAGTFALARTGAGEISPQISGAAAISTVIAAVDSSSSIQQIRRGVGYTIDSPLISAPNTNGPYSNTGDYGDDL